MRMPDTNATFDADADAPVDADGDADAFLYFTSTNQGCCRC